MKLYIPTCTLNFNNIFSTESISPAAFYVKRDFGNRRFYKVEANNLDNVLMLYSKYPYYHVENGEIENSALVLEIETDDYDENKFHKVQKLDGVEVFAANSTIYLNPFHCKVYFQSWQERQSVLVKAEQSLENKYSKIYAHSLIVRQEKSKGYLNFFDKSDSFDWNPKFYGSASEIHLSFSNEDALLDRLKGAVTCYLLGANMSVSKEVSQLRLLARKMCNTLSSIINSPQRRPTEAQDEELLSYIKQFNSIYENVDENCSYNRKIIEQSLVSPSTGLDKEQILKVLKDLHLESDFKRKLPLLPVYDAMDLYSCLEFQKMNSADAFSVVVERLYEAIKRVERKEQLKTKKIPLTNLISVADRSIKIIDPVAGSGSYISRLLGSLINGDYKEFMAQEHLEESLAIAFVGGKILKDFNPQKWEGSVFQKYINGLLENLQRGVAFDLFSIDNNVVLQSFAAFCQKGDDVDRLTDYMLQCGFSDYRFALSILGAAKGFSSLPKTFTSTLIDGDCSYYSEFNKVLYKWLFGNDLKNISVEEIQPMNLEGSIPSKIIENIDKIEPKQKNQDKVVRAVSNAVALEDAVQSPRAFMFILDSFPKMKTTSAYKALDKAHFIDDKNIYSPDQFKNKIYEIVGEKALKSQKENIDRAIELEAKRHDPEAFLKILDNFLSPKEPAYKKISKLLDNEKKEPTRGKVTLEMPFPKRQKASVDKKLERSLFDETLPDIPCLNSFWNEKELKRLEDNWNYTIRKNTGDKREQITHFINLCKQEGRGDSKKIETPLLHVFTSEIAAKMQKELFDFYDL